MVQWLPVMSSGVQTSVVVAETLGGFCCWCLPAQLRAVNECFRSGKGRSDFLVMSSLRQRYISSFGVPVSIRLLTEDSWPVIKISPDTDKLWETNQPDMTDWMAEWIFLVICDKEGCIEFHLDFFLSLTGMKWHYVIHLLALFLTVFFLCFH